MKKITLIAALLFSSFTFSQIDLKITEIFPGQVGADLTEDWFEIHNQGNVAWVSGVDPDLFYDDDSADASTADLIQGITDIQPGERVIIIVTDNMNGEVAAFNTIWSPVVNLTGIEVGYTDGSGLGSGGDAVNLWIGDPNSTSPMDTASYPDTAANDGQSFDIELTEFSTRSNASNAVGTITLGGDANDVPNIASPGNVTIDINLSITEIFPGQAGADLTEDWFEIHNTGTDAWVSGVHGNLTYDDESADASTADLIQGITDIQPNERVIVLVTDNANGEVTTFNTVWSPVVNLSGIEVGYTDGSGLGSGGDAANIWIGNPNLTSPVATGAYPDTASDDGKSFDLEENAFSVVGNPSNAVATVALGGDANDTPNIASPGNVVPTANLVITEIFPGQEGADLTEDWFEIHNTGTAAWVSGMDPDLFYDDDSAAPGDATIIQGITDIQPGERVIVLVTDNMGGEVTTFNTVWSPDVDLTGIEVGYTAGSGLGAGGDTVTLWLGDPNSTTPIDSASYPDTAANDGQSYDIELSAFSTAGNASNAVATTALGGDANDTPNIASPGNVTPPVTPQIQFSTSNTSVDENGGTVTVTVNIDVAPTTEATVQVSLAMGGSAVEGTDFTYAMTQNLTFATGSTTPQTVDIQINNNNDDGSDVYFVLKLENANNADIGSLDTFSVYILDDDTVVPTADDTVLNANFLASYVVDASGTAEITAYDPNSQRLFVTNDSTIEILDFSDPSAITSISTIPLPANTDGVQSVAVSNGILAAAIASDPSTDNGIVMFSDIDGNNAITVTVGSLPDMITFTPDGTKLLVANEGEPSSDYTIDPEGSVSIIDVTGGLAGIDQSDVTNVSFNAFDSQQAALVNAGVRIFGPGATLSQDLEPEYITVSEETQTAYVSLQENNAIALIDLTTNTLLDIFPLGLKDHSLPQNSLDTSDEPNFIFNSSWPIYGMYMPDAIDHYHVGGIDYIVTANEGDARDYNAFQEERKLGDSDYNLDPTVFTNADILAIETNLGDINISNASGNTDGDPEFEEIHVYGARSFSIFNANTRNIVYDSGNDFEVITAADATYGGIFNASNSNNSFKNRSDNKGPEPEGVIVEEIDGSYYAFVLLERIGGVMIYDVTDPTAPVFLQYVNSRGAVPGVDESGDLGPEGIVYVSKDDSPTGTALIVVSNEVSATLSIYSLDNITLSADQFTSGTETFSMFPNPSEDTVNLSQEDDYKVFDLSGRLVRQVNNTKTISVNNLATGMYIVTNSKGIKRKLLVK